MARFQKKTVEPAEVVAERAVEAAIAAVEPPKSVWWHLGDIQARVDSFHAIVVAAERTASTSAMYFGGDKDTTFSYGSGDVAKLGKLVEAVGAFRNALKDI